MAFADPRDGCEPLTRIAESGAPFLIGDRYAGSPDGDGKLHLQIVPSPWGESTGLYRLKIAVKVNEATFPAPRMVLMEASSEDINPDGGVK